MKNKLLFSVLILLSLQTKATEFNLSFINGEVNENVIDLLSNENQIYLLDIILNEKYYGRSKVNVSSKMLNSLCLKKSWLEENAIPINFDVSKEMYDLDEECYDFNKVSGGIAKIEKNNQKIILNLPQAYLNTKKIHDQIEYGQYGFKLLYNINGDSKFLKGGARGDSYLYGNFDVDANINKWIMNIKASGDADRGFKSPNLSLSRIIYPVKGRLSLGKSTTSVTSIDNFSYVGVSLESRVNMWPSDMQNYAPIIEGNASTNSRITIKQDDYVVYSAIVPAGRYVFDDIKPVYNGDLVVIEESLVSDFRNVRIYPVSKLPTLLRPGYYNYDLVLGKKENYNYSYFNNKKKIPDRYFALASFDYGLEPLTFGLTSLLSSSYYNLGGSITVSLANYGAVSATLNRSWTDLYNNKFETGNSFKIKYAKAFGKRTNVTLLGYHYMGEDYYEFANFNASKKEKERIEFNLDHRLTDKFSINLSGINTKYNNSEETTTVNLNFGSRIGIVSYNLNSYYTDGYDESYGFGLNFSLPIKKLFGGTYISSGFNYQSATNESSFSTNTNFSDNDFYHTIGVDVDKQGARYSLMSSYNHDYSNLSLSLTQSGQTASLGMGASGMIVGVEGIDDLVLSQIQADTVGVAHIENLPGVKFNSSSRTDENGNTLVQLSNYRDNTILMEANELPKNIKILTSELHVVPSEGSINLLDFDYQIVKRYFLRVKNKREETLVFGSMAFNDKSGERLGIIDQTGLLVMSVAEDNFKYIRIKNVNDQTSCKINISNLKVNVNKIQNVQCL